MQRRLSGIIDEYRALFRIASDDQDTFSLLSRHLRQFKRRFSKEMDIEIDRAQIKVLKFHVDLCYAQLHNVPPGPDRPISIRDYRGYFLEKLASTGEAVSIMEKNPGYIATGRGDIRTYTVRTVVRGS